jgi:hypothetical protein
MKHKVLAVILVLTVISWAQTVTPTPQSSAPVAKCACCDKASADAKDAHAFCARHGDHHADAKEMASCCNGKEGASCCGKDAKSCIKDGKNSCSDCGKDKTAKVCCGSNCKKGCEDGTCCGSNKVEKGESRGCCDHNLRSQLDPSHN